MNASKLGTVKRRGGALQVTYAGKALYWFYEDSRPGPGQRGRQGQVGHVVGRGHGRARPTVPCSRRTGTTTIARPTGRRRRTGRRQRNGQTGVTVPAGGTTPTAAARRRRLRPRRPRRRRRPQLRRCQRPPPRPRRPPPRRRPVAVAEEGSASDAARTSVRGLAPALIAWSSPERQPMLASAGTTGPHVSSSHCDGADPVDRTTIVCGAGSVERLGLAQDRVRSGVVGHRDERRHLDLPRVAADLVAVTPQDLHLVADRCRIGDEVARVGVLWRRAAASCARRRRRSAPVAAVS